jgi:hypothetical protein
MRAFVAAQFTVSRFGAWRIAVWLVACLAVLLLMSWCVSMRGLPGASIDALAALGMLTAVGLALQLTRLQSCSLRWDGQAWYFGLAEQVGDETEHGSLTVMVDLGAWMLLRFAGDHGSPGWSVTWLPVQRRGMEAQWHALRCAVYSPIPEAAAARNPRP